MAFDIYMKKYLCKRGHSKITLTRNSVNLSIAGNVIWKYSQTKFSSIIEYLNRKRKIVGKYTMAFQIIKVNLPIKEYNLEFNSFFLP